MVEVKRIKAPSDIPAEGKLCPGAVRTVRDGPGTSEGPNSHGADGKRDKVKLDEFAAAVETAKALAETKHFQTVYVIDEADAKRTIGQPKPR